MVNEYYKELAIGKNALVVSCYRWEWQQVLSIEGARALKDCGYQVKYLELSGLESNVLKELIKSLARRNNKFRSRLKLIKSSGIIVHYPHLRVVTAKSMMHLLARFRVNQLIKSRWEVIYPGLVDLTKNINVSPKNEKKLTKRIVSQDLVFTQLIKSLNLTFSEIETVLIVNGRFPLNRAAADYFRANNQKVRFIEFASNRERFQLYDISPHSMANRQILFKEYIESSTIDADTVFSLGSSFFQGRRKFDKQANLSWTRKMDAEKIPEINDFKKVCTFFPTSEKEFAGVGDIPPPGHFRDQHEALNALIRQLDDSWDIYIRRHPSATDAESDPEAERWEKYKRYANVQIINPDSTVDSYALGMRSTLVAHYSSFIGPELIFAGHNNVVTLGPTQWEHLDPERHLHNSQEIADYFNNDSPLQFKPDIHLLGFYMSRFGEEFKLHRWDASKNSWVLNQ